MIAIKGYFDGSLFVPEEPVNLLRNKLVILHVGRMPAPKPAESVMGFLDVFGSLVCLVDAPADWSTPWRLL